VVSNQCVVQDCSGNVSYTEPTANDNCPGVTLSCVPASDTTNFTIKGEVATNSVTCTATDASGNTTNASFNVFVHRWLEPVWLAPLTNSATCLMAESSAEPTNSFKVTGTLTNRVEFLTIGGSNVTASVSNSVSVSILFSLNNQTNSTGFALVSNVVAVVASGGKGTAGTSAHPAGRMTYVAGSNWFEFDANTTGWITNTLHTSQFYLGLVTTTHTNICTTTTNGYGNALYKSQ
jgi:hypothetical protein